METFTKNLETIARRMSSKYQDDSRALCLSRIHEPGDPGLCQNLSAKHREECIKAFNRASPLVTSTLVRACASLDWPYMVNLKTLMKFSIESVKLHDKLHRDAYSEIVRQTQSTVRQ